MATSSFDLVRSSVVVINCMVQMYILMYILSRDRSPSCFLIIGLTGSGKIVLI